MARAIEKTTPVEAFSRSIVNDVRLAKWVQEEVEDAFSARLAQEVLWDECLRQYNGVPKNPVRNTPVEDAPNIEVTLGAIACDALYAQGLSQIFATNPIVAVQPTGSANEDDNLVRIVAGLQTFTNWMQKNELRLRKVLEHSLLDVVQLGTAASYTPYVRKVRKTKTRRTLDAGPQARAIPTEDIIQQGGANEDPEEASLLGFRVWFTEGELMERAKPKRRKDSNGTMAEDFSDAWIIKDAQPTAGIGFVRRQREKMGRTHSNSKIKKLYEICILFCYFDYDQDGFDEDLMVVWDRTSGKVLWVNYSPNDKRPIDLCVYQVRAHMPYGIGVMEMLKDYQTEVTETHNDRTLNAKLANMRMYKTRTGEVDEGTITAWAGRNIVVNDMDAIQEMKLSEVYPSATANEASTISLAERRVGVNELNTPRPSQVLGSRTPAFTTSALLQQQNIRFAPAFDAMRTFASNIVVQGLWRYRERILLETSTGEAAENIRRVLGEELGNDVVALLREDDFMKNVSVELSASSAKTNQDAERQNAILLAQLLNTYYEKTIQLVSLAANPQTPEAVRDVAKKIANTAGEVIERTIRTFDEIRDPSRFIIDMNQELDSIQNLDQGGLMGLAQQLLGGGGAQNGNVGGLPDLQ